MDLVNYAELVFDLAPDMTLLEGVDLTSFTLFFSDMALQTNRVPERNTTVTPVKNIIKSYKQVTEGWESKLNSTNAGYGIVLALVIVVCIAFAILFTLTMRRINQSR